MESEAILHASRAETLVSDTKIDNDLAETVIKDQHASFVEENLFEYVAEGLPLNSVEEGVEAECANTAGVEALLLEEETIGLVFQDGLLSFTSRDCLTIPTFLLRSPYVSTKKLDLSFNALLDVKGLESFVDLEELVLDNNSLTDEVIFPNLLKLRTLSLNKNQMSDLDRVVSLCRWKFPNLNFLSLLGNPCCPNLSMSTDEDDVDDYQRFRYFVIHKLPSLKFLDFTSVTATEQNEAQRRGKYLATVKVEEEELDTLLENQTLEPVNVKRKGGKSKTSDDKKYSPLPSISPKVDAKPKEAFGKCRYVYYGKQSEGNRFISNDTL